MARIEFGSGINIKHSETFVRRMAELAHADEPVVVDFANTQHVDPGAAWRVGNALQHIHPPTRLSAELGDREIGEGRWFLVFDRSLLGLYLSKRAGVIRSGRRDITAALEEYYRRQDFCSKNLVGVAGIHKEGSGLNLDSFDSFVRNVRSVAEAVQLSGELFDAQSGRDLARLCFEGAQNAFDHSAKQPLPVERRPVTSYCMLRYFAELGTVKYVGDLQGFLKRTRQLRRQGKVGKGYVEALVVDDGAGLAARHVQDNNVYASIEEEVRVTERALNPGESVKWEVSDSTVRGDPGFGFTWIADCLEKLSGYGVLRTGRVTVVFDGTMDDASWDLLEPGGKLPGTVLSILIPRPTAQRSLWESGEE
jgi:hypothetical protein